MCPIFEHSVQLKIIELSWQFQQNTFITYNSNSIKKDELFIIQIRNMRVLMQCFWIVSNFTLHLLLNPNFIGFFVFDLETTFV